MQGGKIRPTVVSQYRQMNQGFPLSQFYPDLLKVLQAGEGSPRLVNLHIDSRALVHSPAETMFIALKTATGDGHRYLAQVYAKGVRMFLVEEAALAQAEELPADAWLLSPQCGSTLDGLQALARWRRTQHDGHVVGITGSNGKTHVKDWLYQLTAEYLGADNAYRSPGSYNSQIGVALSVWAIPEETQYAFIEAGISQPGEMENLEAMIQPTSGIFTMLGDAHLAAFRDKQHLADEKAILFKGCDFVVCPADDPIIGQALAPYPIRKIDWGFLSATDAYIQVSKTEHGWRGKIPTATSKYHPTDGVNVEDGDVYSFQPKGICVFDMLEIVQPVGNMLSVAGWLSQQDWFHWGYPGLLLLTDGGPRVEDRLQILQGPNNTTIIRDVASSDLTSLRLALDTLSTQHQHDKRTVILSDILGSGIGEGERYAQAAQLLRAAGVSRVIGVGPQMTQHLGQFGGDAIAYISTEALLDVLPSVAFGDETVLVKGSSAFKLGRVADELVAATHSTLLHIDLNAVGENLTVFRSLLRPGTKIMAMVKALSYGAGQVEIANELVHRGVDFLAVAYTDEAIALRKQGIFAPTLVMSPQPAEFRKLVRGNLSVSIHSLEGLRHFAQIARSEYNRELNVHLKLDTGMHRLGLNEDQLAEALEYFYDEGRRPFNIEGVYSHLSGSEDPSMDEFTQVQISQFNRMAHQVAVAEAEYYRRFAQPEIEPILRHLLNTSGIARHPIAQYEMVRVGIGLYGLETSGTLNEKLSPALSMTSKILSIREVPSGESVGYGTSGKLDKRRRIATIGAGYADGLDRRLGNGGWKVMVNGQLAPTIGNICMDMSMIDVSGIDCQEGDVVEIFGKRCTLTDMAKAIGTIPYELMARIPSRVRRVYLRG